MSDQDDNKPKVRKLKIKVTPTLVWHSTDPNNITATLEFSEDKNDTDPPMDDAVDAHGNIDLSKMPKDTKDPDKYADEIDIKLVLDKSKLKGPDGKALKGKARWATSSEGGYTYNGKAGWLGYGWFCTVDESTNPPTYSAIPPATITNMTFERIDDDTLMIDDNTPTGSPEYAYCFAFVLEGYGNYYISVDPRITSKGVGQDAR